MEPSVRANEEDLAKQEQHVSALIKNIDQELGYNEAFTNAMNKPASRRDAPLPLDMFKDRPKRLPLPAQ